jgi:hypothetical protein
VPAQHTLADPARSARWPAATFRSRASVFSVTRCAPNESNA